MRYRVIFSSGCVVYCDARESSQAIKIARKANPARKDHARNVTPVRRVRTAS